MSYDTVYNAWYNMTGYSIWCDTIDLIQLMIQFDMIKIWYYLCYMPYLIQFVVQYNIQYIVRCSLIRYMIQYMIWYNEWHRYMWYDISNTTIQ